MCDNEQCNLMPIHNNMFYSSRFTVRHHNVMVCHLLLGRIDLYIYNSPKFSAGGADFAPQLDLLAKAAP
jgi:hypothetical protein